MMGASVLGRIAGGGDVLVPTLGYPYHYSIIPVFHHSDATAPSSGFLHTTSLAGGC